MAPAPDCHTQLDGHNSSGSGQQLAGTAMTGPSNSQAVPYRVLPRPRCLQTQETCGPAVAACALFCAVGPALMFVNNHILRTLGFKFPVMLTLMGMGFTSLSAGLLCCLGMVDWEHRHAMNGKVYLRQVVPIGLLAGGSVYFSNLAYLYLGVAYIQMLKAATPAVVFGFGVAAGMEQPNTHILTGVTMLIVGPLLSSIGESQFSLPGLLAMVATVICESVKGLLQQHMLANLKFGVVEGVMYSYAAATVFLLAAFFGLEYTSFRQAKGLQIIAEHRLVFLGACTLSFAVNFAAFLVIRYTSSLTHRVLSHMRNSGVIIIAALVLNEVISALQVFGFALSCVGTLVYGKARTFQAGPTCKSEMSIKVPPVFDPGAAHSTRTRPRRFCACLMALLCCCMWTIWNLFFDTQTVNYGISRPAFWVDLVAWYVTYLCAMVTMVAPLVAAVRQARAAMSADGVVWQFPLFLVGLGALLWLALQAVRVQNFVCWGHGTDYGFLSQLQGSMFPLQIAHYSFTKDVYLRRRRDHFFHSSEKNEDDFEREQSFKNVCTNTAMRRLHQELQSVDPTPTVSSDGIYLIAAMYTAVQREGPNIDLWIEHHLRLGFDYVHVFLDFSDNALNTNTALFVQWGDRIRITNAGPNCSQGCAKKALVSEYAGTVGWLEWIDADEFIYPTRWNGKETLRHILSQLRFMGYCEIGMPWILFGDSGHQTRPSSPLEAFVHTSALKWAPYGKSATWVPALDPTDGFQHAGSIRKTIPFCKKLERGVVTTLVAGEPLR
eukprot:SAG25_NODE_106_length_15358_cov_22.913559_3_plen_775_part_00